MILAAPPARPRGFRATLLWTKDAADLDKQFEDAIAGLKDDYAVPAPRPAPQSRRGCGAPSLVRGAARPRVRPRRRCTTIGAIFGYAHKRISAAARRGARRGRAMDDTPHRSRRKACPSRGLGMCASRDASLYGSQGASGLWGGLQDGRFPGRAGGRGGSRDGARAGVLCSQWPPCVLTCGGGV